ncbi:MAG: acyl-CoA dehydrogenase family protein [Micromonosporaceae bacterium]
MDFSLGGVDDGFLSLVRELGQRIAKDDVISRDRTGEFSHDAWRELATAGLTGLCVPGEYGGRGDDAVTTVAALEALGESCTDNGLMFALGAHLWACAYPLARFGDPDQRARWLPGLAGGSLIGAHAATEAGAGSDAAAIRTAAIRAGDGWTLHGVKTFITNAPVAGLFLVTAVTEPDHGPMGISGFLVPGDAPGLTVGPAVDKSGLRTAPMAEVRLDDCRVGADALLGAPGAGMAMFTAAMTAERAFILAPALGVLHRLAEQCAAYARRRRQFGAPLADFQAVSHRIADARLRAQNARLLAYWVAWLTDQRQVRPHHAAMVKLQLAESLLATALDAVQLHGGTGYTTEPELERMVRDAMGARIYSGTSEIQRDLIARTRPGGETA